MNTKYVIIIPDGAADNPIEQFGGKTCLEAADKPNMDAVSRQMLTQCLLQQTNYELCLNL